MTTRTTIWIFLILGGLVYQCAKIVLGYAPKWEDVLDCAWWSGVALLWHWHENRPKQTALKSSNTR